MFPILNPRSHLPPRPIPLGHPSAPAPSILYQASNLDWFRSRLPGTETLACLMPSVQADVPRSAAHLFTPASVSLMMNF